MSTTICLSQFFCAERTEAETLPCGPSKILSNRSNSNKQVLLLIILYSTLKNG